MNNREIYKSINESLEQVYNNKKLVLLICIEGISSHQDESFTYHFIDSKNDGDIFMTELIDQGYNDAADGSIIGYSIFEISDIKSILDYITLGNILYDKNNIDSIPSNVAEKINKNENTSNSDQ